MKRLREEQVTAEEEDAPITYWLCACDIGLFYDHFYRGTGKIVNTWNISRIFIVLWLITAKIRTRELATKPQIVINVLACRLIFSRLIVFFFSRKIITFQKYFWCSWFSRFDCKLAWDQAPHCGEKEKKSALAKKKSPSAWFARRYFSYLTPFFAFFPNAEPGPRLPVIRNLSAQYALRGICC